MSVCLSGEGRGGEILFNALLGVPMKLGGFARPASSGVGGWVARCECQASIHRLNLRVRKEGYPNLLNCPRSSLSDCKKGFCFALLRDSNMFVLRRAGDPKYSDKIHWVVSRGPALATFRSSEPGLHTYSCSESLLSVSLVSPSGERDNFNSSLK